MIEQKTYVFNELDDKEKARIAGQSVTDNQKEAQAAQKVINEIYALAEEVAPGKYNFEPAAEAQGVSKADITNKLANAHAHFQELQSANYEKVNNANWRAAGTAPIVGEEALAQVQYQGGAGGELLFSRLENIHGMERFEDFGTAGRSITMAKASLDDIKATVMSIGGGTGNTPTGIQPSRPVQAGPYEAVDLRRSFIGNLSSFNIGTDTFTYWKEIDAGVYAPNAIPNTRRAEGAAAIQVNAGAQKVTLPMTSVGSYVTITEEQAADVQGARAFASMQLSRGQLDNNEKQYINGDGNSQNPTGLLHVTGSTTDAKVATDKRIAWYAEQLGVYGKPRGTGAGTVPSHILMSFTEKIRIMSETDTEGRFLHGDPVTGSMDTLWGIPMIVSDHCPENTAVMFNNDPRYIVSVQREGITLKTGLVNDDMIKNQFSIAAFSRNNLAIIRPGTIRILTALQL